jgi:hypothetical protein
MEDMKAEEDFAFINYLRMQGIAVENLDTDELDALYEDYAGKRDLVASQQAQAQALLGTAAPEGRQAGNIYAASNPLETLGQLGSKFVGAKMNRKATADSEALNEKMALGQRAYARELAAAVARQGQEGGPETPTSAPDAAAAATTTAAAPPAGAMSAPPAAPVQSLQMASQTPPSAPAPTPGQPGMYIRRPGPQRGGMAPGPQATSTPLYLSMALRSTSPYSPENTQLVDEVEQKRRRKLEEVKRKTGFLNDMYGGF